jgi:DNA-binding NarL/FixJ family response regulator
MGRPPNENWYNVSSLVRFFEPGVGMRVLLATGLEKLDQELSVALREKRIEIAGICPYREALVQDAEAQNVDTVILSPVLPGTIDIITDVILQLRARDIRVLLLAGKTEDEKTKDIAARAVVYGVYDIIYDPVTPEKVIERLLNPAGLAEASKGLSGIDLESHRELVEKLKELHPKPEEEELNESKKVKLVKLKEAGVAGPKLPKLRVPKIKLPNIKLPKISKKHPQNSYSDLTCTIWNPSGFFISNVALNFAVISVREGYDAALLNFNLVNPETDIWFGIKQRKEPNPYDAGIMTFGERLRPDLALKMLQERAWGVKYLPAGNKFGNLGIPDFGDNGVYLAEGIITAVANRKSRKPRLTVIEASNWYEHPFVYAALKSCQVLIIPMSGSIQEEEIVKQHLKELRRLDMNVKAVKLIFAGGEREQPAVKENSLIVPQDWEGYRNASAARRPYCLIGDLKGEIWSWIFLEIVQEGV